MSFLSRYELCTRLQNGERFLADGAMGTELMRRGVPMNALLTANRDNPQTVLDVHAAYIRAGAQFIAANTFGDYPEREGGALFRAGEINAGDSAIIAETKVYFSVSLTAKMLLDTAHGIRFDAVFPLAGVLIETCVSLSEALSALYLARLRLETLTAVTCHFRANGLMPDGTTPEDAARILHDAGAAFVGANCGDTPESFVPIAERMRSVTDAPLLFQPSAGLPTQNERGEWIYPYGPEAWADIAMQIFDAGASIVGGCCGTTPAHIAALAERMQNRK
jgi:5-methyltetrahydrofolate--homocysteine methyltransferase